MVKGSKDNGPPIFNISMIENHVVREVCEKFELSHSNYEFMSNSESINAEGGRK